MGSKSGDLMIHPLMVQPLDSEYAESFRTNVVAGMDMAAGETINVVAIARNCGEHLTNTLECIDSLRPYFGKLRFYAFENDSVDGTAEALDAYAAKHPDAFVEHDTLKRPDLRGWEPDRTVALAEYRNRCRDYVEANWSDAQWTIVLDMDPHGGFLPDGVFNSIYWLATTGRRVSPSGDAYATPGAMASYSILRKTVEGGGTFWAHYDAYAARPMSWWRDRKEEIGMGWFQHMMMPIGAPPMRMNSAFGGLCLYRTDAFLSSRYSGGDCEHVNFHRGMAAAAYDLYLNPGSVYVAVLG
jgi:hypothetical protein